jgi:hypothetical protein
MTPSQATDFLQPRSVRQGKRTARDMHDQRGFLGRGSGTRKQSPPVFRTTGGLLHLPDRPEMLHRRRLNLRCRAGDFMPDGGTRWQGGWPNSRTPWRHSETIECRAKTTVSRLLCRAGVFWT